MDGFRVRLSAAKGWANDQTDKVQVGGAQKGDFVLNAEIIETVEETPDTVVTLTNGKKLIVEESMEEIVRRVMEYRRGVHGL